jgi:hypothetical protein
LDLSVARDADYVIIKEKMNRKTPKGMPKWFKEWSDTIYENRQPRWFKDWSENQFEPLVNKVNKLDTKFNKQDNLLNTIVKTNNLKTK